MAIMNENKSYVFFREITGAGPLGALGVAVTPRPQWRPIRPSCRSVRRCCCRSIAPEPNGIWVAQDTGGAHQGLQPFRQLLGRGRPGPLIAGGMSARGSALILLPVGTYARLASQYGWPPPQP